MEMRQRREETDTVDIKAELLEKVKGTVARGGASRSKRKKEKRRSKMAGGLGEVSMPVIEENDGMEMEIMLDAEVAMEVEAGLDPLPDEKVKVTDLDEEESDIPLAERLEEAGGKAEALEDGTKTKSKLGAKAKSKAGQVAIVIENTDSEGAPSTSTAAGRSDEDTSGQGAEEVKGKRKRKEKERAGGPSKDEPQAVPAGIWALIDSLKEVVDDLEDEGAARKKIRALRKGLDQVGSLVVGVLTGPGTGGADGGSSVASGQPIQDKDKGTEESKVKQRTIDEWIGGLMGRVSYTDYMV